ncbi:hypothetical protein, partial [Clostridium sp. HBUAS56010]|uniref:hypothetical protein n=1 Tax=Clostridium sp. HBUAS56010 TaxID=2571127 RepID=UPI00163D7040
NSNLADIRSDMGGVKFAYISGGTATLKTTDSDGKIYIEFNKYAPNEYYNLFVQGMWVGSNVLNVIGKYNHGFDVELRNNTGAAIPNETITFDWFAVKFG